MPSGRVTDSTWITSAPSAASIADADGPAHHAVRSRTLTPCSGSVVRRGSPGALGGRGTIVPVCSPRRGDGRGGGAALAVDPPRTRRGTRNVPVGSSTSEPRAFACSNSTTAGPSHTGATGMRSSAASATTSAVVCFGREVVDDPVPLLPVHDAVRDRRPVAVLDEVGALDHQEEAVELGAGVGVEADVAVGRRLDRRRLEAPARRARVRATAQRVHEVGGGGAGGVRDLGDGEVDELARATAAHDPAGGERRDRGVEAAHPLHRAPAHLHGCAVGASAHRERAALGLQGELGGGAVGVRALEPVRRDRHDDELREALVQRGGVRPRCRCASVIRMSAPARSSAMSPSMSMGAVATIERWPKCRNWKRAAVAAVRRAVPVAAVGPAPQGVALG